jgi:hypothetical protein
MYVEPESIKCEVNEITKTVAKDARERDDYDARFYSSPEDSPVTRPRRKPVKPAPPDDIVPTPPL